MAALIPYNPQVFPVVAPPGWKAILPALKSTGQPCTNSAGHIYTSGGIAYPPERPIISDDYLNDRSGQAHHAEDIMAANGAPIVADQNGTVTEKGVGEKGGNYIYMMGDDGVKRYYAHMLSPALVNKGDRLSIGELIGFVGATGNASGGCPHLHYQVSYNGNSFNAYPALKSLYDRGLWKYTPKGWDTGLGLSWQGILLGTLVLGGVGAIFYTIYHAKSR